MNSTRFAALADDNYMNDTPSRIYSAFDTKQSIAADATKCGVSSALSKVIVTSPSGDYTSTPSHLKTAPGLKTGGAYIGDEEWCTSRLSEALSSRLSNQLANLYTFRDSEHVCNTSQISYLLARDCANAIPGHWLRTMPGRAFLISRSVGPRPPPQRARAPYVENKNKTFSSDFQACGPSNRRFPRRSGD